MRRRLRRKRLAALAAPACRGMGPPWGRPGDAVHAPAAAPVPRSRRPGAEAADADAPPFLARSERSESIVDSGYSGQDAEADDDTTSTYSGGSSDCDSSASASGVKDVMHRATQLAAPLTFEGDILVENSTNVQFGNNTHYHGPVTVLLSSSKTVNGSALPGAAASDAVVLCASAEVKQQHGLVPTFYPPTSGLPSPAARGPDDIKSLTATEAPCSRRRPARLAGGVLALAALLVGGVLALVLLLPARNPPKVDPVRLPNGLTLVPRDQWLAQPPKEELDELPTPVDYVVMHHSATASCFNMPECILRTRYLQMFHMESQNWSDIAYNFLVGGDGYVYVGRDWDKAGAHTLNWNYRSVGICLVGTFSYQRPTNEQMAAAIKLIEYGVQLGRIAAAYKLAGVCQLRSTESPGRLVYEDLRGWPHWWNYTAGDSNCK